MSKLKQSIAVLRQIPEHVRENYPVFVEFLRMYYEYLQETQQQDLEGLHDVDVVSEEFIGRFTNELAKNFPTHLINDKRLVLKHLREFYLSRGSESSYKFLFRTLFGKEADLYYPSRQMLRVSDGRWIQDTSIFVQPINGVPDVNDVTGKFVFITNNRGKVIRSFVKNVVKYSDEILEVFIERDYANEINVGATVTYDGLPNKGIVLSCPAKIKVFRGGKGFKAGSIYALKTQLGRGCVIKVTKVDSVGAIKSIQVIRFGLDYETTFYSYLSSKDNVAFEYIHPLKIGAGSADTKEFAVTSAGSHTYAVNYLIESGNPLLLVEVIRDNLHVTPNFTAQTSGSLGTSVTVNNLQVGDTVILYGITAKGTIPAPANPAYGERSGGFVEYGWGSKQNYFYYDEEIPIGDAAWAVDRYFADPAYVGEIVQQFYADDSVKPLDEDLAIIEIDLGAVAKYPGYYSTADGFISDEMFIQDGNYYQAFSYVIKVEEELRRYADIIKALVHPAGMKVFSEYYIFNELKMQYSQPRSFLSLTLPMYDHPPSSALTDDRGVGLADTYDEQGNLISSAYTVTMAGDQVIITPNPDATKVYSNQGKMAGYFIKRLMESVAQEDAIDRKYVEKLIIDEITERYTSVNSHDDSHDSYYPYNPNSWVMVRNYDETISKLFEKNVGSITSGFSETLAKYVEKAVTDIIIEQETYAKDMSKPLVEVQALSEAIAKWVEKPIDEYITSISDVIIKEVFKNMSDSVVQTETYAVLVEKLIVDLITDRFTSALSSDPTWTIARNYDETIFKEFAKNTSDIITSPTDSVIKDVFKDHQESISQIETYLKQFFKPLDEQQSQTDTYLPEFKKSLSDQQALSDVLLNLVDKAVSDATGTFIETLAFLTEKIFPETIVITESYINNLNKTITELQSLSELYSPEYKKNLSDITSGFTETLEILRVTLVEDVMNPFTDLLSNGLSKPFDDFSTSSDSQPTNSWGKLIAETINTTMSGTVVLNPFNIEGYFAEDYTPSTPIT